MNGFENRDFLRSPTLVSPIFLPISKFIKSFAFLLVQAMSSADRGGFHVEQERVAPPGSDCLAPEISLSPCRLSARDQKMEPGICKWKKTHVATARAGPAFNPNGYVGWQLKHVALRNQTSYTLRGPSPWYVVPNFWSFAYRIPQLVSVMTAPYAEGRNPTPVRTRAPPPARLRARFRSGASRPLWYHEHGLPDAAARLDAAPSEQDSDRVAAGSCW